MKEKSAYSRFEDLMDELRRERAKEIAKRGGERTLLDRDISFLDRVSKKDLVMAQKIAEQLGYM